MSFTIRKPGEKSGSPAAFAIGKSRRTFFKKSGIGLASAGVLLAACNGDDDEMLTNETVDLGSGDAGILNYAYALEQLEAAFYDQVLKGGYYASATADEKAVLADLEAHERAHREFLKTAINSVAKAIPDLEVDFSTINFGNRDSVLGTAKAFEDLGVSAYNGAGMLLKNADYLLVAGKIVSVEARHAAVIRSLIEPGNPRAFAGDDVIDNNGLDKARMPSEVLKIAGTYIKTKIDASNLPS